MRPGGHRVWWPEVALNGIQAEFGAGLKCLDFGRSSEHSILIRNFQKESALCKL